MKYILFEGEYKNWEQAKKIREYDNIDQAEAEMIQIQNGLFDQEPRHCFIEEVPEEEGDKHDTTTGTN